MWKFWKKKKVDEEEGQDLVEVQEAEGAAKSEEAIEAEGSVGSEGEWASEGSARSEGEWASEESAEGTWASEEATEYGSAQEQEESARAREAWEEAPVEPVDSWGEEELQTESFEQPEAIEEEAEQPEAVEEPQQLEETEDAQEEVVQEKKKGFFARLKEGLKKTRDNIARGIDRLFSGSAIDEDFYEELEEILIMGDIGVNATTAIIDRLKDQVKELHLKEPKECRELLIQGIREQMEVGETAYDFETKQSIIMVIGVNGVGKTTTVGKLAWKLKDEGKKVLIAAADTFRAAAGDQLAEWARRAGVPMIGGKEGADPASVVFDAVNAAKARGVDVLLVDTAGRLHNKKNLMEELRKMNRIIDKEYPNAHRENLIVLDGTTGQNALAQAREFGDVTNLTGIVLTKMDGTAKGGIAVAIQSELGIPVKYIGVGETTQDLQKFDPDDFVRALFDVDLSEKTEEE